MSELMLANLSINAANIFFRIQVFEESLEMIGYCLQAIMKSWGQIKL